MDFVIQQVKGERQHRESNRLGVASAADLPFFVWCHFVPFSDFCT